MEKNYHTVTITVYDRESAFHKVSEILHSFAEEIVLRVGHPIKEHNVAVIFLILNMTQDRLGAFSGKLGQIQNVKVKSTSLKIDK